LTISLKKGYYRDANHNWTISDIRDIGALSLAVPYCDVVVTDRQVAHALTAAKLGEHFGTSIFSRLSELVEALSPA
jgi:hypothetical protein